MTPVHRQVVGLALLPKTDKPFFGKICDSDCVRAYSGETKLMNSEVKLSEKLNLLL